jgi:hypothetical protein
MLRIAQRDSASRLFSATLTLQTVVALKEMTTKVRLTCVQRLVPHFVPKPFAVEKAWRSGTAVREGQFELDPPRKRRAESIPNRPVESEDDSQYTNDRAKVLRDSFLMTLIKTHSF